MKIKVISALIVGLLLLALTLPVAAANGDYVLGTKLMFRIHSEYGGLSQQQRVDVLTDKMIPLLTQGQYDSAKLRILSKKGEVAITYAGHVLITIDPVTAKMNGKSRLELASDWAKLLNDEIPESQAYYKE